MGPFNSVLNRKFAKWLLPKVSIVIGRGRQSESNLKGLGLKNVEYCADGAFTMNYHEGVEEKIESIYKPLLENEKIVGISPSSLVEIKCRKHGIDYSRIFGEFIDYLQSKEYKIILILHAIGENSKFQHNNDSFTIQDILSHVKNSENVLVVEEDYSSEELRMLIKQTDFCVVSRFHAMISALAMVVPEVVFGWGYQKYVEVLDEFKVGDYAFDGIELSAEKLISEFEKMVENEAIIKKKISDNLPKVIKSSRRNLLLAKTLMDLD
jgi:polysaccharide pyruvyl transferase WcaK-like protein